MPGGPRAVAVTAAFVALALVPPLAHVLDQPFYQTLFARVMIFALAALSLDLILGFGGMVSFGHAAYLGVGAYAVGILSFYGVNNGFAHFGVAILGSALVAFVIGAICLRTDGIYFIMITLAFTQMLYFLGISLEVFGGDDGMNTNRSEFLGAFRFKNASVLYYTILAALIGFLILSRRIVNSRFGMVVRAARSNERRLRAIGVPAYRYKLLAFVLAGVMCGVAGAFLANLTEFITPEYMHWTRSGEILVMVVMGGMGTLSGAVLGSAAFLLLEEVLSSLTQHWMIVFGPLLVLLVLFARRGLAGLLPEGRRRSARG